MSACLFGLEAELALSTFTTGAPIPVARAVSVLEHLARSRLEHVCGVGNQCYLANGGLFHIDSGQHPEIATPECLTPVDAVAHLKAAERQVAQLLEPLRLELGVESAMLCRGTVDYVTGATWGCHESYLARFALSRYQSWLIPHFASRTVYTGCGGLAPECAGIEFTLSPRASYISCESSGNSIARRGIFHTKQEPLSSAYGRIHCLCGDNTGSQLAQFLRVGSTALIVALAESDRSPPFKLRNAARALREFARNPDHRAEIETPQGNRPVSALELQYIYLTAVEAFANTALLPDWAAHLCTIWRATLQQLERPEGRCSPALDWTLKRELFGRELTRAGFSWDAITVWSRAVKLIQEHTTRPDGAPIGLDGPLLQRIRKGGRRDAIVVQARQLVTDAGLRWADLEAFAALRRHLCALDVRFGEIGRGVFDELDRLGLLPEQRMVSEEMIADAALHAPAGTRATLRARWIRKLARRRDFRCDWSGLHSNSVVIDLNDPFAVVSRIRRIRRTGAAAGSGTTQYLDFRSLALEAYCDGDYTRAEGHLRSMIERGRELPGTHVHLARVLLTAGRVEEAAEAAATAYSLRGEAPGYVALRIGWFQLCFWYLNRNVPAQPETPLTECSILTRLKDDIVRLDDHMEWTLEPLLAVLEAKLSVQQHQLLAALAQALSNRQRLPTLDAFPAWRELPACAPE